MKRYRVLTFEFDTRAEILRTPISDAWEPQVREQWRQNQESICQSLLVEFGQEQAEEKKRNFIDIGPMPMSVLAFHNEFTRQVRKAFIVGAYYPALTGAGALCERILNHLLRELRESYVNTPEYRKVYRKDSFDNWRLAIDTLASWGVLTAEAVNAFNELLPLRNRTIHFQPDIDHDARSLALDAVALLDRIILAQFPLVGDQPWFLSGIPGESYISQAWEQHPFIKRIYLPNCLLVGPAHRIESLVPECVVRDFRYVERAVSDPEFADLRGKATQIFLQNGVIAQNEPSDQS